MDATKEIAKKKEDLVCQVRTEPNQTEYDWLASDSVGDSNEFKDFYANDKEQIWGNWCVFICKIWM